MISSAQRIGYENLRSLAFGSISSSYAGVGVSFVHPVRMIKVTNLTDINLIISFDGTNDKDIIPSMSAQVYDYATNRIGPVDALEQPAGQRVYVKQETVTAATSGNVYVTVIYASAN